ncbi:MAG TPA: formate/nitrite transporter family protein [Acidimicrobiales bacterium]
MPVPISETLDDQEAAAAAKARTAKTELPKYLVTSGLAGAYVGVAVVLLLMVSAAFVAGKSPSTKLVQGAVFGIALTLVVFAGAELFTGNVMVMLQGLMRRKVTISDLVLVWAASLLGNLGGSIGFAALVNASGVMSSGAPKGQQTIFMATLAGIVKSKAALSGGQLFFRSVLCNMLVCLALWMAARTRSDAAKLLCLWWALLAFIASGFEHSIANMTIFGLGIFGHVSGATWAEMSRNLLYTVPGNIVGGGVLVGMVYGWTGREASPSSLGATGTISVDGPGTIELETAEEGDRPAAVAPRNGAGGRRRATTPPPRRTPVR